MPKRMALNEWYIYLNVKTDNVLNLSDSMRPDQCYQALPQVVTRVLSLIPTLTAEF